MPAKRGQSHPTVICRLALERQDMSPLTCSLFMLRGSFQPAMSGDHMLLAVTCDVINQSTCLAGSHLLLSIHGPSQCHRLLSLNDPLSMNRLLETCLVFPRLICRSQLGWDCPWLTGTLLLLTKVHHHFNCTWCFSLSMCMCTHNNL